MIELYNPREEDSEEVTFAQMEVGTLYYLKHERDYDTTYTKTLSGHLLWFEPPTHCSDGTISSRVNIYQTVEEHQRFIKAPHEAYIEIHN